MLKLGWMPLLVTWQWKLDIKENFVEALPGWSLFWLFDNQRAVRIPISSSFLKPYCRSKLQNGPHYQKPCTIFISYMAGSWYLAD